MFPFGGLLSGEVVSFFGASKQHTTTQPALGYITLYVSAVNSPPSGLLKGYVMWDGWDFGESAFYQIIESWVWGTNFQRDYWIRVTLVSGDAPTGSTMGIWLPFTPTGGQSQFWRWQNDTEVLVEGTVLLEVADDAAGANVLSSAEYTMGVVAEVP